MSAAAAMLTGKAGVETIRTGLLGREILASRSPWMHEAEGRAQSLLLTYELFDFTARGWGDGDLAGQLQALGAAGFAGVNITHPFKQTVLPLLDALAPSAQCVGAVNTVRFEGGRSIGHNTDMTGFAESVRQGLADQRLNRVVQFGAGGAGSATGQALLSLGVEELFLIDPDQAKAEALAARLTMASMSAKVRCVPASAALLAEVDGIVNASPSGMAAHPGAPFDPDWLAARLWVADIVYFPLETVLLREARARGCATLNGKGMAVFQAADAFEIFTGNRADRSRMIASFDAFGGAAVR